MRKYLLLPILLIAVIFTASCSDLDRWNQDPYAGQDDVLKGGEEKPSDPVGPKPIPSDAVRIRAPDFVSFKELRPDTFAIVGQVLLPDYEGELEIENLSDFSGAVYDSESGEFTWTPPKGSTGNDLSSERVLKVNLLARKAEAPTLIAQKSIRIGIARAFTAPEIVEIKRNADTVREGTSAMVEVTVRDLDANPVNAATWPKLEVSDMAGQHGLAQFIVMENPTYVSGLYRFRLKVDLADAELTSSSQNRFFKVSAKSQFYVSSGEQTVTMKVLTKLQAPISTWTEYREITAGAKFDYDFLILDQKGEGVLNYDRVRDLPQGADLKCDTSGLTVVACRMTWQTTAANVGSYTSYVYVRSRNRDSSDSQTRTESYPMRIRVMPAPTTTTTTTTLPAVSR